VTLVRYTADGGHFRVGGHGFDPGDERDVDDELAEYLADREDFEVLEETGEAEDDESDDDAETGTLPFNPESHTVDEIEERVTELDDPAEVRAVRNLEQEQQGRTTAVDAINDRLEELEG
jgi:hypothetical protein